MRIRVARQLTAAAAPVKHGPKGGVDLSDPHARRLVLEALYKAQLGAAPVIPKTEAAPGASKADARTAVDHAADLWLEERLKSRVAVNEQDLLALGRARAEAAQAVVLADGKVEPSRVFIVRPATGEAKGVRMALSMH